MSNKTSNMFPFKYYLSNKKHVCVPCTLYLIYHNAFICFNHMNTVAIINNSKHR